MKSILAAVAVVLFLGSTACGHWYVGPRAVCYPAAVYAYPAPVYAYLAPVYAYPAPVYPYRVPVTAYPYVAYSPVVAAPAVVPAAVWYGPPGVVVRSKVYIPGRPVRNVVRAVVP
ncbi:MAG: hypothetical protein WCB27_26115 [Thermoguttaceae bacterium]